MSTSTPTRVRVRYRPRPHPAVRDRWSPTGVLDALDDWMAQMGAPPRRHDWSGERPATAGPAQRRWMREFPRWPSSSCVAAHFGTWSAALQAAGLPVRALRFDDTPAQRVARARLLATAGIPRTQIASRLGVSPASVHNYLHARPCPRCGGPVTNPRAEACLACTRGDASIPRTWTQADARTAIHDWIAEHGRPPAYREWTPSDPRAGRWRRDSPRWPSAAVVCRLYADHPDPWRSALRDAAEDLSIPLTKELAWLDFASSPR